MEFKPSIDNIDPVLFQQFLNYREKLIATELTSASKSDNNLCMRGKIRTKEKCPKCKGSFQDTGKALVCSTCLTTPLRYYIDIYWNKKIKVYSDTDGRVLSSYELAQRVLIQVRQEIDHKIFDPKNYEAKSYRKLQFQNYAKEWLKGYEKRVSKGDISFSYYRKVKQYVDKSFIPFFQITDIREIRSVDIKQFYHNLSDTLSLKTQKNILDALNKIFKDAFDDGEISQIPKFPKFSVPEPSFNWVDEDIQDKIIAAIPQRDQTIYILMSRTGIRPGEARALQKKDFNLKDRHVIIDKAFSENKFHNHTKNKRVKIVPLDDYTVEKLKEMPEPIKPTDFMFTTTKGTPYSHYRLWEIFRDAAKKVGVDNLTMYQGLKHSFASQAINRGVPKEVIQKILGHLNSKSTDRYAKLELDTLRAHLRPQRSEALKRPQEKNGEIIPFKNNE